MEYGFDPQMSRADLDVYIQSGWRRQGQALFRPACVSCNACISYRVPTATFQPNRSQRRVIKANRETTLEIGRPSISVESIALYVEHHNHHAAQKGWKTCTPEHAYEHITMLGSQNFVEEWCYRIEGQLVAISYIDVLDEGLSGVYFFHHPGYRNYSLGNWIVLSMILRARQLGMPYAYLGLYVPDCRSMAYKAKFLPAERLEADGQWRAYQPDAEPGAELDPEF